jgi:hypothetical protein
MTSPKALILFKSLLIAIGLNSGFITANVTSTSGNINFDVSDDGSQEAHLNNSGLGIGLEPSSNLHIGGNSLISEKLTIGSSSLGSSNLRLSGTMSFSIGQISSNTSLGLHSMALCDSSSGNLSLTLPNASSAGDGKKLDIKKTSPENDIIISGNGGSIDSISSVQLTSGNLGHMKLVSYSGNWHILSISGNTDIEWIIPIAVHASSEEGTATADKTISSSPDLTHESVGGTQSAGSTAAWSMEQGNGLANNLEWILFDLGTEYTLTKLHIWQFMRNTTFNDSSRGIQQFDVFVSSDNLAFTEVLSDTTLNQVQNISAGRPTGIEPVQSKELNASGVRYVRLDIDSTFEGSGSDWQGGFSKVRFEGH